MSFQFFLNGVAFGVVLTMDTFSVSMVNGLNEPRMKQKKAIGIAGTFALYQIIMPLIGWVCVHTVVEAFTAFKK